MNMELSPGRKFDKVIENESGELLEVGFGDSSPKVMVSTREYLIKRVMYLKPAGFTKHVRGSIYDTNQNWFHWTESRYL